MTAPSPEQRLDVLFYRLTAQPKAWDFYLARKSSRDAQNGGLQSFKIEFRDDDHPNTVEVEADLGEGTVTRIANRAGSEARNRKGSLDLSDGFQYRGKSHGSAQELAEQIAAEVGADLQYLRSVNE